MAGTHEGGVSAAETNKDKYGADFYHVIGAKGGRKGRTGGFHAMPKHLVSEYGRLGGSISRRGGAANKLSKHKVDAIKTRYNARIKLLREQSDMQVKRLSRSKYAKVRTW